jgi:hypothetical protein
VVKWGRIFFFPVFRVVEMRLVVLLGSLLLLGGGLNGDEDCVEGEEGCDAPPPTKALPKAEVQRDIYVLTDDNFAEIVKEEDLIMATFYAPW